MADILNPVNGYRGNLQRNGIKPVNHMQKNRTALRKKEEEMREKEESH
jgi:hypothetical protein